MKPRWITIALIISAAFNLAFLGAVGYRLWTGHARQQERFERFMMPPQPGGGKNMPPEFERERMEEFRNMMNPRISDIRRRLFEQRRALSELMIADKPDTVRINEVIERIGGLQVQIEKEIIYGVLKEESIHGAPIRRNMMRLFHERLGEMPDHGMAPGPPMFPERDTIPEHRPER